MINSNHQIPFSRRESTCIQVCPDYGKNLLFALVQKWPMGAGTETRSSSGITSFASDSCAEIESWLLN